MKKLADISAFERLQGQTSANASSDITVFNETEWLYSTAYPVPVPFIYELEEIDDPIREAMLERMFAMWERPILQHTGGKYVIVGDENSKVNLFDRASKNNPVMSFGFLEEQMECKNVPIWVMMPGKKRPWWAIGMGDQLLEDCPPDDPPEGGFGSMPRVGTGRRVAFWS